MAFATKDDYCGLVAATTPQSGTSPLSVRSATENASGSTYAPDGEDGATIAVEAFGANATPSNEYALTATLTATAGSIQLGKVVTIDSKKYRLASVSISTAANSPVKVTANAQLVESSATDVATNNLDVPAFEVLTKHVAQDIFGAFDVGGSGANLIGCDVAISATVGTDTLVGAVVSNGIGSGTMTISGTILMTGDSTPTVTPTTSSGWVLTKAPTCTNPETAYPSWTFELQKPLARHTAG